MEGMGIFRYLVQLTRRAAHAVTVHDEPPDFAVKVDTPLTRRIAHAVAVRVWVRRLSLINRYARSQVCQPHGPVVSLTTHGDRVATVYLTIESIGRGELRPSRIILWLDEAAKFSNLPAALCRLQKRGLEVKLCKNYGPHTKYYPYVESEKMISQALVTADDDILYPSYWLKKLVEAFQEFPDRVNCYRARVITVREGEIVPYARWEKCTSTESSFRYLATGVSGVIYSPQFLKDIRAAGNLFEECCPKADDLWLHVQALRSGYKIRQIGWEAIHFAIVPGTQKVSLFAGNVTGHDGNDRQIRSTYRKTDLAILLREGPDVTSSIFDSHVPHELEIAGGGLDGR
jgi:hypothetical protein